MPVKIPFWNALLIGFLVMVTRGQLVFLFLIAHEDHCIKDASPISGPLIALPNVSAERCCLQCERAAIIVRVRCYCRRQRWPDIKTCHQGRAGSLDFFPGGLEGMAKRPDGEIPRWP